MLGSLKVLGAVAALVASGAADSNDSSGLLTDINVISRYWGEITPYEDNPENYFGVKNVGLPDGCQVVQAHTLQRHANRFPSGGYIDGGNDENFANKLFNFTKGNPKAGFSGPLGFLNTYKYIMGEQFLNGLGAAQEFQAGVQFWNRYGRLLYNATAGQLTYNSTYPNGTARPKPVLRTTSQTHIYNSEISWALGFFGPSYKAVPDPKLTSFTPNLPYDVVVIPDPSMQNNSLAAYDSCFNFNKPQNGDIGDRDLIFEYVPLYLKDATARFQKYAPSGFSFTYNDTYAMQSICAYETSFVDTSDFCNLFTADEWAGFENTLDIQYYYDVAWGGPTGRAQGVGYLQELLARLTNQYITSSNSSVNYTLDNNAAQFPLGQPFYADFTHDDILISVLTAESLDYLKDPPSLTQYPPDPKRRFQLGQLVPWGATLITEAIACNSANPTENPSYRTQYYPTQYGYNPNGPKNMFIRQRLNNGILPLSSIRGGLCAGRTDGMCSLNNFLQSQYAAQKLANYDFSCFANYTLKHPADSVDYDGQANKSSPYINYSGK